MSERLLCSIIWSEPKFMLVGNESHVKSEIFLKLIFSFFLSIFQCCGSGIRCFFDPLDPGSGMGKNPDPRSGINISDQISESLVHFRVENTSILF
jgi:hypothetical protein